MSLHRGPSLGFDLPRDWEDRTILRYEAPVRPGATGLASPASATVERGRMQPDEDLARHVERRLRDLATREGFLVREVAATRLEDHPAARVRYASVPEGVPTEHFALLVQLRDRVVATLTLSAPRTELAQLEPLFERMLERARILAG